MRGNIFKWTQRRWTVSAPRLSVYWPAWMRLYFVTNMITGNKPPWRWFGNTQFDQELMSVGSTLQQLVVVARACTHVPGRNAHKHIVIRAPCRFILQRTSPRFPVPHGIYRPPLCVHPSIYLIRLYVSCAFVIDRASLTEIENRSDSRWDDRRRKLWERYTLGLARIAEPRSRRPLDHLRRSERDKDDYSWNIRYSDGEREQKPKKSSPKWTKSIICKIRFK